MDPTHDQWTKIADIMQERKLIPWFDIACECAVYINNWYTLFPLWRQQPRIYYSHVIFDVLRFSPFALLRLHMMCRPGLRLG